MVGLDMRIPFAWGTVGHSLRSSFRDRARGLPWSDARVCAPPTEGLIVRERPVQVTRRLPGRDACARRASCAPTLCQPLEDQWSFFAKRCVPSPTRATTLTAALAAIIAPARATPGVMHLDIARDLLDHDSFIATAVYEDGAALAQQESAPEVHRAMAMLPTRWRRRRSGPSSTQRSIQPWSSRTSCPKCVFDRPPSQRCRVDACRAHPVERRCDPEVVRGSASARSGRRADQSPHPRHTRGTDA